MILSERKVTLINILIKIFIIYLISVNIAAFIIYGVDKRRAKKQKWRISEATLFVLALIGGSVGSEIAMYIFHHKTRHMRFVIGIPCIILLQLTLLVLIFRFIL